MKILNITLIIVFIFAVIFAGFFYYSTHIARESATLQATSTASSLPAGSMSKINPSTAVPVNFHGPTSQPTIHGPSGPPPGN